MAEKIKRTLQVPHTYTIIFVLMILVAVLTWIVPSGAFDTTESTVARSPCQGPIRRLTRSLSTKRPASRRICAKRRCRAAGTLQGIEAAVEVVAFIFIVGGAFQIITQPGPSTPA